MEAPDKLLNIVDASIYGSDIVHTLSKIEGKRVASDRVIGVYVNFPQDTTLKTGTVLGKEWFYTNL